jgi:hypothetical protein
VSHEQTPHHVGIARFAGTGGAELAFADARDGDPRAAWLGEAAFVEVRRGGRIVVRGSVAGHYVDLDGERDPVGRETGIGAIAGAAAGLALGPSAVAIGLVGGAIFGGSIEAGELPRPQGPAFDAIRAHVPEGASAIVVVSDAERVAAMGVALAGAADAIERYRLSPAAAMELQSALARAPLSTGASRPALRFRRQVS